MQTIAKIIGFLLILASRNGAIASHNSTTNRAVVPNEDVAGCNTYLKKHPPTRKFFSSKDELWREAKKPEELKTSDEQFKKYFEELKKIKPGQLNDGVLAFKKIEQIIDTGHSVTPELKTEYLKTLSLFSSHSWGESLSHQILVHLYCDPDPKIVETIILILNDKKATLAIKKEILRMITREHNMNDISMAIVRKIPKTKEEKNLEARLIAAIQAQVKSPTGDPENQGERIRHDVEIEGGRAIERLAL